MRQRTVSPVPLYRPITLTFTTIYVLSASSQDLPNSEFHCTQHIHTFDLASGLTNEGLRASVV